VNVPGLVYNVSPKKNAFVDVKLGWCLISEDAVVAASSASCAIILAWGLGLTLRRLRTPDPVAINRASMGGITLLGLVSPVQARGLRPARTQTRSRCTAAGNSTLIFTGFVVFNRTQFSASAFFFP